MNYNILIPIDGSECSMYAAKKGIELAKDLAASVILLSVVDLTSLISNAGVGVAVDYKAYATYKKDAASTLDETLKKYPYNKAIRLIEEGVAEDTINGVAKELNVDMIIMGSHGRTGLNHIIMGSVAEHVIRHADVPVMALTLSDN